MNAPRMKNFLSGALLLSCLIIFNACGGSNNTNGNLDQDPNVDDTPTFTLCGNGVINPGEECDGSNLGDIANCSDLNPDLEGNVSCNDQCAIEDIGCTERPGYAGCFPEPEGDESNCLTTEECFTLGAGAGVCAQTCENATDCPSLPEGLTNEIVCLSNACFLSCSSDDECPENMLCGKGVCFQLFI